MAEPAPREHGSRAAFLERARLRLAGGIPVNRVHPPPAPDPVAPRPEFLAVDPHDLPGTFARIATDQGAEVHATGPEHHLTDVLRGLVELHDVRTAVCSSEPETEAAAEALTALGVEMLPSERPDIARADLGVTSATALVAATGSLVLDCSRSGTRTISLLPRVHLCVAPLHRLVATPGDVWRTFTGHPKRLPSNLVWVSGPSRTGDIEQLLTIGVHGPTALAVVLTE